jgi:hypothetical protein
MKFLSLVLLAFVLAGCAHEQDRDVSSVGGVDAPEQEQPRKQWLFEPGRRN